MRRFRFIGLIASVATVGAMLAAPVLAAGPVEVQLQFNAQTLQAVGTDLTGGVKGTTPKDNPCRQDGGTFADASVNSQGLKSGSFTPSGSPVPFLLQVGGNDAVCLGLGGSASDTKNPVITGKDSTSITVPSGKYSDAYFLAAVGNGPSLVDVTPVYGSTQGKTIQMDVPDWCVLGIKQQLPSDAISAGINSNPRVNYDGTAQTINCGYFVVHLSGLDSSQTLTGLNLKLEPAKTAITMDPNSGKTQDPNGVVNIAALTVVPAGAALPKTGGNETGILIGVGLLLAGAGLAFRPRLARGLR